MTVRMTPTPEEERRQKLIEQGIWPGPVKDKPGADGVREAERRFGKKS